MLLREHVATAANANTPPAQSDANAANMDTARTMVALSIAAAHSAAEGVDDIDVATAARAVLELLHDEWLRNLRNFRRGAARGAQRRCSL